MADIVKQILAKPIQLADQVTKAAEEASSSKQECFELKSKTEKLALLLRQAARASSDLYERPTRRIIDETEQVLDKALSLVLKCRANGIMKRVFTIIPAAQFRKMSSQLENSIGDLSWLLRVSAPADTREDGYLGLPPIAANEPILCLIWEQIAILHTGSVDDRSDAAASLVSLAKDNDRYGKLIIEEGGVGPLLKLIKEGKMEGQEHAAEALGLLGRDPESVEHMIHAGVCSVFAKILKEGPMRVQAMVARAISELASHYPKCQDLFAQHNIIRLLVSHLAFETVQEHSKYAITFNKATSIHAVVVATNNSNANYIPNRASDEDEKQGYRHIPHPLGNRISSQMHNVVTSTMAMQGGLKPPLQQVVNGVNQANQANPANQAKSNGNSNSNSNAKQNHQYQQSPHHHQHNHSGTSIKGRELEDPATKATMKAMAARALWQLAKGNSPICRSITESRALLCFAVLLEKGSEDVQLNSAMALMEITAVAAPALTTKLGRRIIASRSKMSFTRAIPRATSTLARTQSVLVQNQARSLSLTAARKSADHGDHYDPPSGWLFGVKPGEKAEKEGWEGLWVYGFFGACAFGVVGYAVKPDTSIQTWALEEARRRLEAEGILKEPEDKS